MGSLARVQTLLLPLYFSRTNLVFGILYIFTRHHFDFNAISRTSAQTRYANTKTLQVLSVLQRKTISSADVIIFNAKCAKTGTWNDTNIYPVCLQYAFKGFIFGTHGSLKAKIKQTLVQKPKHFIERAPVGFIIFYYYVRKTTLTATLSKQDCDKVLTHCQVNLRIIQGKGGKQTMSRIKWEYMHYFPKYSQFFRSVKTQICSGDQGNLLLLCRALPDKRKYSSITTS